MNCQNCGSRLSCGCQKKTASDGKQVCANCIDGYEQSLKQKNGLLEQERALHIDLAIVRVMKTRKNTNIKELMSEVVSLLTLFRPELSQIKKRIESLVERGYMKRSDEDISIFIYLP